MTEKINELMDKVRGVFIGGALGDALGAPHEFRYHKDNKYTGILHHRFKFNAMYQATRYLVPGQTTDDTEMSLTLAHSMIRNNGYDRNDVIMSYERWANNSPLLGINTRTLFKGVKTIKGYEKRYNKLFSTPESIYDNQSNGSMMRCFPLAFLWDNEVIVTDCKITNPSPVNIDANLVYINAIRLAILGYDRITIFNHVKEIATTAEVKNVLIEITDKKERNIKGKTKGWVLHTFYCAMWSLLYTTSYQEGIDYIVLLGGDTDTTAAISGALLGALFGYTTMFDEERTKYNMEILLTADTSEGDIPRPTEYTLGPIDSFIALTNDFYTKFAYPNLANKMLANKR